MGDAEEWYARVISEKLNEHLNEICWAAEYGRPLDPAIPLDIARELLSLASGGDVG